MADRGLDYALVGLTLPELAAVRDELARAVDEKRLRAGPVWDAYRKVDGYYQARKAVAG